MSASEPVTVALDHNFPTPLLVLLGDAMPEVRLVAIRDIDPRLAEFDDDTMIVALHQLQYGCLVTTDRMLHDPVTLVAIEQTRFTLGVVEGVGDDPIRAVGASSTLSPRTSAYQFSQADPEVLPIARRIFTPPSPQTPTEVAAGCSLCPSLPPILAPAVNIHHAYLSILGLTLLFLPWVTLVKSNPIQ